MRCILLGLAVAAAVVGTGRAEPTPSQAGATPLNPAVFRAFHGRDGIDRIVVDMLAHVQTDPRIADIFKAADLDNLHKQLSSQLCYLAGGDCVYGGKDMSSTHKDMGLQDADLNALVENLQNAMDREHVPFSAQNQLLARLAPMRRLVVVR